MSRTINIQQGALTGIATEDASITEWRGIPFAQPPVGPLRWRAPQPPKSWDAEFLADSYGPECLQMRASAQVFIDQLGIGIGHTLEELETITGGFNIEGAVESEDCLYLNVRSGNAGSDHLQPVMVWIHGGGHVVGTGSDPLYNTNALAKHDVVTVTINYRLGLFGYLAHPALSAESEDGVSGNYGLLDQIAALQWVKDNITAFGGDPHNVTIFGESAGGQSCTEIMASPLGDGLYHKAIMQSGVSSYFAIHLTEPIGSIPSAEDVGRQFLESLCNDDDDAQAIRNISGEALIAQMAARGDLVSSFLPATDGKILPKSVAEAIVGQEIPDIPIIAGFNADEGTLFYPMMQTPLLTSVPAGQNLSDRIDLLVNTFGEQDGKVMAELYDLANPEGYGAGETQIYGDSIFGVHTRLIGKTHAQRGLPAWLYFFSRVSPKPNQTAGAFHSSDVPFTFDSHNEYFVASDQDFELTRKINRYWTNFAKTGNPNGAGVPDWPKYDAEQDVWLRLDHQAGPIENLRKEKLDILEREVLRQIDLATKFNPAEATAA